MGAARREGRLLGAASALFRFGAEAGTSGDDDEEDADDDGERPIDEEGGGSRGVRDEPGHVDDEEVAQGAGEEPEAGHDTLEALAGGGVGVLSPVVLTRISEMVMRK